MNPPCDLRASFAHVLKQWRLRHHLTQKQVSSELGFGLSTVSAWETAENFPDGDALGAIAGYTYITPCRLFCDRADRCAPGQCRFLTGRA
jgi:transcriptional regulator with XRE-family HTH domain